MSLRSHTICSGGIFVSHTIGTEDTIGPEEGQPQHPHAVSGGGEVKAYQ